MRKFLGCVLCVGMLLTVVSSRLNADVIRQSSEAKGAIRFELCDKAAIRVQFAMISEHGEYARFEKKGWRAEVVYDAAVGEAVSLHYPLSLKSMIELWRFNRSASIAYGDEGNVVSNYHDFHVQQYSIGKNWTCVGFDLQWDGPPYDPLSKPSKILFGDVCREPSRPFTKSELDGLFDKFHVEETVAGGRNLPQIGGRSVDAKALAAARGAKNWGAAEFPFEYGHEFDENASDGN